MHIATYFEKKGGGVFIEHIFWHIVHIAHIERGGVAYYAYHHIMHIATYHAYLTYFTYNAYTTYFTAYTAYLAHHAYLAYLAYNKRVLGSIHSLLCPSILWMQCFQGSMERCIKSPCMKVAYLTYFAYLISISIFNILWICFCSRIGWRSACGFLLDWSSNGGWAFSWKVIFCIFNVNMLFRIMLYWALCVFISPTTTGVTLFSTPDGSYGTRGSNAYLFISFCAQEIEEVE